MEKLHNIFTNPYEYKGVDLSRETEKTYIEIPPYTVDEATGEVLNDTNKPILKEGKPINVYEKIQSYHEECDIYSILKKVAQTGDESLLNKKKGFYGDVSEIPDNLNDIISKLDNDFASIKLNKQIVKAIARGDSNEQIQSLVNKIVDERVKNYRESQELSKEASKAPIKGGE